MFSDTFEDFSGRKNPLFGKGLSIWTMSIIYANYLTWDFRILKFVSYKHYKSCYVDL